MKPADRKIICTNKRAARNYTIEDTFEAGIVLVGPEVKSLRAGEAHLRDSYARITNRELWLMKAYIAPYEQAHRENPDPDRPRKLLLNRSEINRLSGKVRERGFTLVPLEMYFSNGNAKVKLALARGKKVYDRRRDIADREAERRLRRLQKRRQRRS